MQKSKVCILPVDRAWAEARIIELEAEIQALGPDFHAALTESNETWHDNAPFDALREKQAVLAAELQKLRELLRSAAVSLPKVRKNIVSIGSLIELKAANGRIRRYLIVGDWTFRAGQKQDGALVISAQAPVALALLGKKTTMAVRLPPRNAEHTIIHIQPVSA